MADKLTERNKRDIQLNEKVSTTQYDVLYPETTALQVITDENHLFVTQLEKDKWNKGEGSMHYKGDWAEGASYVRGDIVRYQDFFFICGMDHTSSNASKPDHTVNATHYNGDLKYWYNIDYESYNAEKARKLKTTSTSYVGEMYPTFVAQNNSSQGGDDDSKYEDVKTNSGLKYNPSTETLTVKNIKGTATEALHAKEADHALNADEAKHSEKSDLADIAINYKNTAAVSGKTNIQTTIEGLNKRIDDITAGTGGAVLSNSLYIKKNGTLIRDEEGNIDGFNGSAKKTIDITITPTDVTGLLNSVNKIDNKWLPDSILGNLRYAGTVNEDGVLSGYNEPGITNINDIDYVKHPEKYHGIYFLASFKNVKNPATLVGIEDVRQGDWLVCNGTSGWVKVDNTDAVTMVNSQIGAVEIYKGLWKTNSHYFKGDIVKYNKTLYIVNATHDTNTNWSDTASNYEVFGRIYKAADGIKLDADGVTFKHDVAVVPGTSSDKNLVYGASFTVPSIQTDAYGHATKVDLVNYKLPNAIADTWRPVVINGTVPPLLDNSIDSGSLELHNGNLIDIRLDGKVIHFDHKGTGYDASAFTAEKKENTGTGEIALSLGNGFTVPQFEYDAYGHVKNVRPGVYRLPTGIINHKHFEVKTVNGVSTIQAFENPQNDWVNSADNKLKFYTGNTLPVQRDQMNFNGNLAARTLLQLGEKDGITAFYAALDTSAGISSGVNTSGANIVGSFDIASNQFKLGEVFKEPGTYSVVAVNKQGIVTYGGAILEFGHLDGLNEPSASLAVGGLFFRQLA